MKRAPILAVIAIAIGFSTAAGAEVFQKLSGAQIRAKLVGRQLTDESHWGEIYQPNGRLVSDEMGNTRVGSWHIMKNQLCKTYPEGGGSACFDVWLSGRAIQMRIPGSTDFPFEGVLIDAPHSGTAPPPHRLADRASSKSTQSAPR
ncbi:hypothetical protein IED13_27980 [Bosea sp. SSUT16]|jgi:hypothetical protein|uniref:DUF995 domain-containing protein n=2 Tax=Bosea TaxID=85413 RepID=A0A927I2F0_9HYPH|nr:hypothetical protein [Bosea spartocytisi]MBD3849554.1 hypothetical protein [Bosea spartocytisi]MCA0417338.1 hypothetical protein [Pseudomonadota bacterium]RTL75027.1 MAG: hypothetical protein EKK36_08240 [Bradyrhizobiaceae bacterium]